MCVYMYYTAPQTSTSVLMVLVAVVCLGVLLLPVEGESPSWPPYLHISVNQKLIAAFALGKKYLVKRYIHLHVVNLFVGLVTMALLKS